MMNRFARLFVTVLSLAMPMMASAAVWVKDPTACPVSYQSQDCAANTYACSYSSNTLYCDTASNITAAIPAADGTVGTVVYSAGLGGGYVFDCVANSGSTCSTMATTGWKCQSDTTCSSNYRDTICDGDATTFSCSTSCQAGRLDCVGDPTEGACNVVQNSTNYPTGANNHYGATCAAADVVCDTNYLDCDGTGEEVGNGCEIRTNYTFATNWRYTGCNGSVGAKQCVTGYLDCDASGTNVPTDDTCEIQIGAACTTGGGLTGVYDSVCQGAGVDPVCLPNKSNFETGTESGYSTSDPLLWGTQYGDGDLINFQKNGGNSFVVDNDANVGIGTTTPGAKLDVSGTFKLLTGATVNNIEETLTSSTTSIPTSAAVAAAITAGSDTDWVESGGDVYRETGNVGIGTTSPQGKMHIVGASTGELYMEATSGNPDFSFVESGNVRGQIIYDVTANGMAFKADDSYASGYGGLSSTSFFIEGDGTGNVGIGTTSPGAKLDIEGSVESPGNLFSVTNNFSGNNGATVSFLNPNMPNGGNTGFHFGKAASTNNRGTLRYSHVSDGSSSNRISIDFYGSNDLFNVLANGNVGIGTTTPGDKLQVQDTSSVSMLIKSTAGSAAIKADRFSDAHQARVRFDTNGVEKWNFGLIGAQTDIKNDFSILEGDASTGTPRFVVKEGGNVGIGTSSPTGKLEVQGGDIRFVSTETGEERFVFHPNTDGGAASLSIYDANEAENIRFQTNAALDSWINAGNVGIGTTTPGTKLDVAGGIRIDNNEWISARDDAGTGVVNMFRTTTDGSIEIGAPLLLGALTADTDSGAVSIFNMPVSSTPTAGTEMSASVQLDSENIFKIFAEADGTGGIQNQSVQVSGDVHAIQYCDENGANCKTVTELSDAGTDDQTLDEVLTSGNTSTQSATLGGLTVDTDTLHVDATNNRVGIGTTSPGEKLHVAGNGKFGGDVIAAQFVAGFAGTAQIITNDTDEDLTIDPNGTGDVILQPDSGDGNVGIGTADPLSKLHINGGVGSLATGLSFGDGDTGLYENSDDNLHFIINGVDMFRVTTSGFRAVDAAGFKLENEAATATNPTLEPNVSDRDTGIGWAGDNILSLIAGGVNVLNANGDGNVGIGTTTPGAKLHVVGTSYLLGTTYTDLLQGYTNGGRLRFNANDVTLEAASNKAIIFANGSGGNEYGRFGATGNFGIGTTTPTAQLHAQGGLTTALTGTVSVTASSDAVTGTSTAFITELAVGNAIQIGSEVFTVSAIGSDTALTLDSVHTAGATDATAYTDPSLLALDNGDGVNQVTVDKSGTLTANAFVGDGSGLTGITSSQWDDVTGGINYASGNVGIGTTEPTQKLQLKGDSTYISILASDGSSGVQLGTGSGGQGVFYLRDASGTTKTYISGTANSYFNAGNVGIGTTSPQSLLHLGGTPGALSSGLTFGDGDTGFYEQSDDTLRITVGGTDNFEFESDYFQGVVGNGPRIFNEAATSTNPTFAPSRTDGNTGLGWAGADQLSLIAGGVEGIRVNTVTSGVNYLDVTPSATTDAVQIATGGTDTDVDLALMPKGTGNVGIGTTSPQGKMHIVGASTGELYMEATSGNPDFSFVESGNVRGQIIYDVTANGMAFKADDSYASGYGGLSSTSFFIEGDGTGNVGIGTTTPGEKLDVVGNIAVSGTVDGVDISTLSASVTTNTAGIATNASDIADNASAIATNVADIATNTANIDINTGVIAGKANLVTGATAGNLAGLDATGNLTDSGIVLNDTGTGSSDLWSASKIAAEIQAATPAEADTLQTVTDRGATTTTGITVGSLSTAGTISSGDITSGAISATGIISTTVNTGDSRTISLTDTVGDGTGFPLLTSSAGSSLYIDAPGSSIQFKQNIVPSSAGSFSLGQSNRKWGGLFTASLVDDGSSVAINNEIVVERSSTATSASSSNQTILGVTDTTAARTITLATADVVDGRIIIIKDESGGAGTNNITVVTEGSETIDGATSIDITVDYGVLRIYSDGTNWFSF